MSGTGESRRWKPPIGEGAKAAFVAAIRAGAPRQEAAAAGGYALNSFYRVARTDGAFRAAWDEAHAASARAERRAYPSTVFAGPSTLPEQSSGRGFGEERIVAGNRRLFQRRKMRHVRFDEARQKVFLAHFSWSCDVIAAAAEAGVCERTVYVHQGKDPAFAAEFQEAMTLAYVRLEAEALRQRLAAQQRLRRAIEEAEAPAEESLEFERVLKLLARLDRRTRGHSPGPNSKPNGRAWTFDEAMALLGKRLEALGLEVPPLPPEEAARLDGTGEPSGGGEP
jgi:hypothetical protein